MFDRFFKILLEITPITINDIVKYKVYTHTPHACCMHATHAPYIHHTHVQTDHSYRKEKL